MKVIPANELPVHLQRVGSDKSDTARDMSSDRLIGQSPTTRALDEQLRLAARSDAKVLITGESGVGKEVAAQLVHERSARARSPLVTVNCAGVPDSLLESEFFGHVRGSFTDAYRDRAGFLETADRGTVFLDEVGEMSLRLQGLLLRFLETGEIQRVGGQASDRRVNVRVIAASNRDLEHEVERRAFREDLFYRLNVIRVHVPPLRARLGDVPLLVRHFVDQFSRQSGTGRVEIEPDVLDFMSEYGWPGNIRELRNVVERTLARIKGHTLTMADLPAELRRGPASMPPADGRMPLGTSASGWEPMFDRMVIQRQPFWQAVYEPFMSRDVTRQQVREIVAHGLDRTAGDYQALTELFNIAGEHKRFVSLLRRYGCHVVPRSVPKRVMKADIFRPSFEEISKTGTDTPR